MHEITAIRLNHLVDPHLHVWAWQIPVYLFLGGLVAGMMAINGWFLFSDRHRRADSVGFLLPGLSLVLVAKEKCIGCKACLASCPYDARYVHSEGYADKCTFCVQRIEQGQDPACVSVCPTRCMHFGDLDDPGSAVSRLLATRRHFVLLPGAGTRPRVFYLE